MKSKILLLILFSLLFIQDDTHAQGDFAPIGAKWHYPFTSFGIDDIKNGYTIQESIKDTAINGIMCRKIQSIDYLRLNPSSLTISAVDSYVSYVYSNVDTIFYYNQGQNRFLHLYVFNLNIGDTAKYHVPFLQQNPNDTIFRMKITDISYINIDGIQLKTIHHIPLDGMRFANFSYSERVGTFLGPLLSHGIVDSNMALLPELRCYVDSVINYKRDIATACDFVEGPTSNNNIYLNDNKIMVYPNPSSNQIQVRHKEYSNLNIQSLEIYDLMGREVAQDNINKSAGIIDVSRLAKGVYWLKVKLNDTSYNRKIVVN